MAPSPAFRYATDDWGFADPARNDHVRDYGADLGRNLCRRTPGAHGAGVVGIDPVTFSADVIFIFSRSETALQEFTTPLLRAQFGCVVIA
jgi:hypothetical protein